MLCDFGMADDVQVAEFGVTTSDRESGKVVAYQAPDLLNNGVHTKETDIYAFGSLIVEVWEFLLRSSLLTNHGIRS